MHQQTYETCMSLSKFSKTISKLFIAEVTTHQRFILSALKLYIVEQQHIINYTGSFSRHFGRKSLHRL